MTYLYQELTSNRFHDAFADMGRKNAFTYDGLEALYEYLLEVANDTGEPIEIDVIGLCCEFTEYASIEEYNKDYQTDHENWEELDTVTQFGNAAIVTNR